MSGQRDELAELIANTENPTLAPAWPDRADLSPVKFYSRKTAEAILAAGWTKPRTITTVEELDALPEGTLISTPCNNPLYRNVFRKAWADGWLDLDPSDREDGEITETAAALLRWNSKDGTATVLWEPTP